MVTLRVEQYAGLLAALESSPAERLHQGAQSAR